MSEVTEGVYRLGTRWANFYLVLEGDEGILVDAGYPRYFKQLQETSQAIGVGLERIRAVIVTHHHVDHAGTAEAVRARRGASVFVGAEDAPIVCGERPSHPPHGSGVRLGGRAWSRACCTAPAPEERAIAP